MVSIPYSSTARVTAVRYDDRTHRYEGQVELPQPDGTLEKLHIAVVGTRRWPFERITRELLGAARHQTMRRAG